jgi:hypothetical protein
MIIKKTMAITTLNLSISTPVHFHIKRLILALEAKHLIPYHQLEFTQAPIKIRNTTGCSSKNTCGRIRTI